MIPGGPAAQEGTLKVGNVIVSANGVSVLGYSHDQIVTLFQSIPIGGTITLTVSQGYSLTPNGNAIGAKKTQVRALYLTPLRLYLTKGVLKTRLCAGG